MRRFVRDTGFGSGFGWVSPSERLNADLFFADLMGRPGPRQSSIAGAWRPRAEADPPPTVELTGNPDQIIVVRGDGTRYHVRRKVRAQVLTRPGRPRSAFCSDDDRVFFRVSWCEGTQGTIDAGANPQGAFKALLDQVFDQINRGESPDQIKQTLENASVQPFLDLDITKVGAWKIKGDIELNINRTGITSTTAKLSADRGWVKLGVEFKDGDDGKQVMVTADIPLSSRKIAGKDCPVQELAVWWDVECLREVPTTDTLQVPGKIEKRKCLFIYFDYAKTSLRRDAKPGAATPSDEITEILGSDPKTGTARLNKRALEQLDYLVGQGYWLTSVDGYASPEGRRDPPAPDARGAAARWEGNKALAAARAEKILKLITTRYQGLAMRRRMRFPNGVSMPVAVGRSERPELYDRAGKELEGDELDRILIRGSKKLGLVPFLEQYPCELRRMTIEDRQYVTNPRISVHQRAKRLFENLRRVELQLMHIEKLRDAQISSFYLQHENGCPGDVVEAAERQWGSRIPFTRPDPPVCG